MLLVCAVCQASREGLRRVARINERLLRAQDVFLHPAGQKDQQHSRV
jgi:hypothetical protein